MSEQQIETPQEIAAEPDYHAELERLEGEYSESHGPEEQPEPPSPETPDNPPTLYDLVLLRAQADQEMKDVNAENRQWRMKEFVADYERTISDTMAQVRNLGPIAMDDAALRRHLIGTVNDDPRGKAAYDNRHDDPKTWRNYVSRMAGEIHRSFAKQELTETSDLEALEASVRGQVGGFEPRRQIDTREVGTMTREQYEVWKRQL